MEAMIKEGGEGALTILIDVVKNEPDLMAAAEAVMLMDKCPDPRSVEAIVYRTRKLPMSGVVKEQMFGSTAAGVLGNKAGRRQLGSHKEAVRKLALDSLEDGPLRQTMAAEILGRMPSKDDVPALVKMMKRKEPTKKGTKPSPYYRSAAAKAHLRIGTPEAIEAVREQLKHTYSDEMEKGTWREVEDQLKQLDSKK
jgi:HEAT repeat protein